jgi:hypothetical protein
MADFMASWILALSAISVAIVYFLDRPWKRLVRMTHPSHCSLFCGNRFLLSLNAGLLVVFTFAQLGQNTGFLAELLETSNGAFYGFVFSDSNTCHKLKSPPIPTHPVFQKGILADFSGKSRKQR